MTTKVVHWIETELSRHYKDVDLCEGVDLDRNGEIEGTERTDRNGDGNVDSSEWQKFMGDNRAALEKLGGQFKAYYSAGAAFKPDNPIHDLLSIESELASPEEVNKAYEKVEEILRTVKKRLEGMKLIPEEKLQLVYKTLKEVGIKYKRQDISSFVGNMNEGLLDCDTSSFVVLTVAHELGWPIYLVCAPEHAFVRWDDGENERFDMDQGYRFDDSYYIDQFDISDRAIDQGVFMKNFEYADIIAHFYFNRGIIKYKLGRPEDAIKDYNRAIGLNPNCGMAYNNRGAANHVLGRYDEAIEDYEKAVELDPNNTDAHNYLDHVKALKINPPLSCLCNTPGHGQTSARSLLSLILTLVLE